MRYFDRTEGGTVVVAVWVVVGPAYLLLTPNLGEQCLIAHVSKYLGNIRCRQLHVNSNFHSHPQTTSRPQVSISHQQSPNKRY